MRPILSRRLILVVFSLISVLAIWVIPNIEKWAVPASKSPGIITFFGVGFVLALFTIAALYFGANNSFAVSKKFLLFAFLYNALIIAVKFTLSPLAVYQTNKIKTFDFQINNNPFILLLIAAIIFLLYFAVFSTIYFYFKGKVKRALPVENIPQAKTKRTVLLVFILIVLATVLILLGTETGTAGIFFLPLLFSLFGLQYLSFVFSTGYSILIAILLLGALISVIAAFSSTADHAIALRNAAILASLFSLGAAFLFIYHALWVVYFLILTTLWPLRVVIPK